MKPGDLVQVTFRRRGSTDPYPIGILIDVRKNEYPLQGERELDYIVMVDGKERNLKRRWLRSIDEAR